MHFFYPICIDFESSCFKVGGNNSIGRHPRLYCKNITTKILLLSIFHISFSGAAVFFNEYPGVLHKNYFSFAIHIGTQNNCLVRIDCQNSGANNITDFIVCGDSTIAMDGSFIKKNKISHIINTDPDELFNIYDPNNLI